MEANRLPAGREREVIYLDSASIAGAPVAYVVVMAAVIAAFSFVPFSIVLSAGSSFPMSQGLYPLAGWILGPWAGAVACGVGSLVGIFLAPHTAGIPWISVPSAASAALFAGVLVPRGRNRLWLGLSAIVVLEVILFWRHAVIRNAVDPWRFLDAYLVHFVGIAFFLTPFRFVIGRLVASPDLRRVALGFFLGTWCAASLMMVGESMAGYFVLNWPSELFVMFSVVVPIEHMIRSAIGAVAGTGVVAGLRAMALVRAREARF